ncbi:WD40 repeat-containing protein MSI4-like protein, partial [Tanacetum coccineum]
VFGSSAEDGILNVWDHNKIGKSSGPASKTTKGLLFRHSGHRDKVVDFHWNAHDPWTIVSVSNDDESTGGGGTLQSRRFLRSWINSDLTFSLAHPNRTPRMSCYRYQLNTTQHYSMKLYEIEDEALKDAGLVNIGFENPISHHCCIVVPPKISVYGSSADDGILNVWDHNKVVDFTWNAHDPWTIVSVSNDYKKYRGCGTLQTDGSVPNTLVIANYEIVKPRVAVAKHISQFSEEARSPYVKKFKTIIHPGEVNRIRELPHNNNTVTDPGISLILSGHQENYREGQDSCFVEYSCSSLVVKVEKAHDADLHCVDWNPIDEDLILTGSADNTIRLFDRRNLITNGIGAPVHIFENHTAAVLCVQWSPDKSSVFGSSAEDGILDVRETSERERERDRDYYEHRA